MPRLIPFDDINDSMFKKEIAAGYNEGPFHYSADHLFKPKRIVTRAELAQTFKNAFWLSKKFDHQFDDMQGHWANEAVQRLYSKAFTSVVGNNNFNPNGTVTREQLAAFLYRAIPISNRTLRDNTK